MSEENINLDITPEEQRAEEEIQKGVNEDELRSKLADEMGIDPDIDSELLGKLVEREKSHHERLSGAIKQKINWREKAKKAPEKSTENPKTDKTNKGQDNPNIDELVDRKLNERLEARDVESLELPDELKAEVKDLARLKGISVREAARLPYIQTRKADIEKDERIKNATPKRTDKGNYSNVVIDPSKPLNWADFDLNTKEGREAWNNAKEIRRKQQQQ